MEPEDLGEHVEVGKVGVSRNGAAPAIKLRPVVLPCPASLCTQMIWEQECFFIQGKTSRLVPNTTQKDGGDANPSPHWLQT